MQANGARTADDAERILEELKDELVADEKAKYKALLRDANSAQRKALEELRDKANSIASDADDLRSSLEVSKALMRRMVETALAGDLKLARVAVYLFRALPLFIGVIIAGVIFFGDLVD